MATNFATRYKKDLSKENLKTKLVRRKSLFQKESRQKEFNKGRQFGVIDVNTQPSRDRELSLLEESGEGHLLRSNIKPSQIPSSAAKTREQERLKMLQRYKAEKELRKLKQQREKPTFKCGLFKPEASAFLPKSSHIPIFSKPKEKEVLPPVRITRSKAKNQLQEPVGPPARSHLSVVAPSYTSKSCSLQTDQHKLKQIYIDKPAPKESKGVQPAASKATDGRTTRTAAAPLTKIPQISRPATSARDQSQKKATNKGKLQRVVKNPAAMATCGMKENTLVEAVKEGAILHITSATDTDQDKSSLEKENLPAPCILAPAPPKRTRSFAPQNFVFKPLEGLTTYKVKPMSPTRANVFLTPCWGPRKTTCKDPEDGAVEMVPQDCGLKKEFCNPEVTKEDLQECPSSLELADIKTECAPNEMMHALQGANLPANDSAGEPLHNVPYFRNLLQCETQRLKSHCLEWEGTAETDIPQDAKDLVRTTIGQTRLLIAERFKQFEGLVDNCEFRRGEKETTCGDLEGFWDMVNFQVDDVKKKIENLRKLQENGWQMVDDVQSKRPVKKKAAPPKATKAGGGTAERRAARKRLAAIKAAVKSRVRQKELETEAVGQEMPKEAGKVMFDGGFFRIESPSKPFPGRTPKSASRISRQMTPRSASRSLLRSCAGSCVVRLGTATASNTILPKADVDVFADPAGSDLGCISEQSDIQAPEEPCAAAEGVAKAPGLEDPSVKMEDPEIAEEVMEMAADLDEQNVLCSHEDSQCEGTCSPTEELHTPECKTGLLLGDFSCDDGMPGLQPNLDGSLFFTPLRNKAEKFVAAASCNDLIVFSPLSFPDGEK
ncbi:disks large-associated protein 5 [Rhineura floridana]|uniref:disks large-associated protein 5 n=1 Tax=Rhineura floridana TaxID=261503 RepID=UPI002AC8285C|nr:disks large-associated protein 5 [Rhineura floridana]